MTDWQRWDADIGQLDGAEWESEAAKYEEAWIETYSNAFVEIAVSRRWKRADAATWAVEIVRDACIANRPRDPRVVALEDVVQIEQDETGIE